MTCCNQTKPLSAISIVSNLHRQPSPLSAISLSAIVSKPLSAISSTSAAQICKVVQSKLTAALHTSMYMYACDLAKCNVARISDTIQRTAYLNHHATLAHAPNVAELHHRNMQHATATEGPLDADWLKMGISVTLVKGQTSIGKPCCTTPRAAGLKGTACTFPKGTCGA